MSTEVILSDYPTRSAQLYPQVKWIKDRSRVRNESSACTPDLSRLLDLIANARLSFEGPHGSIQALACCATTASSNRAERFVYTLLAIHDMQRALFHGKGRFFDCFAQGWMGVSGPTQVFAAPAKFDDRRWFSD